MSTADTRGFRYPLEAVALRRKWTIDRIQGGIAAARVVCAELKQKRDELGKAYVTQASLAGAAWTSAPDPATRQRMLGYLAYLREEKSQLEAQLDIARGELRALEQSLKEEQIRLNTLEEHRCGLRDEYVLGQQRMADAGADVQWLTLSAWRRNIQDRSRP